MLFPGQQVRPGSVTGRRLVRTTPRRHDDTTTLPGRASRDEAARVARHEPLFRHTPDPTSGSSLASLTASRAGAQTPAGARQGL